MHDAGRQIQHFRWGWEPKFLCFNFWGQINKPQYQLLMESLYHCHLLPPHWNTAVEIMPSRNFKKKKKRDGTIFVLSILLLRMGGFCSCRRGLGSRWVLQLNREEAERSMYSMGTHKIILAPFLKKKTKAYSAGFAAILSIRYLFL